MHFLENGFFIHLKSSESLRFQIYGFYKEKLNRRKFETEFISENDKKINLNEIFRGVLLLLLLGLTLAMAVFIEEIMYFLIFI